MKVLLLCLVLTAVGLDAHVSTIYFISIVTLVEVLVDSSGKL